jgi:hypothetical protein
MRLIHASFKWGPAQLRLLDAAKDDQQIMTDDSADEEESLPVPNSRSQV